jgi:hypothetical protein
MSVHAKKRETPQEELQRVMADPKLVRWFVVRLDETNHWSLEILREFLNKECAPKGRDQTDKVYVPPMPEKIYATYMVSPDIGVHICSLTPSVEAWFLEDIASWPNFVEVPEDVYEYVSSWVQEASADAEMVTYFDHVGLFRNIDTTLASGPNWKYLGHTSLPGTEEHDEERDALFEYERGNPSF